MGYGATAHQVAGTCQTVPASVCNPFKELCIHTVANTLWPLSSPAANLSGLAGCPATTSNNGTWRLPPPKIPDAIEKNPPVYGQTTTTKTMPYFYQSAGLTPWKSRRVDPSSMFFTNSISGPAVDGAHMVTEVRRRLRQATSPNNSNYLNRNAFDFTDATTSINGQQDWLGPMNPAGFFWTNKGLTEPFLAGDYYEDSGQSPAIVATYGQNLMPFCTPVNAYDSGGNLLGSYVGYTVVYYFCMGFVRPPINPYLPADYYNIMLPDILPTNQIFMLDSALYMVASPVSSGSLKSPRLNRSRWWHYNRPGNSFDICDQYMYFLTTATTMLSTVWRFDVVFPLVGGGTDTIQFNLSNWKAYVTP